MKSIRLTTLGGAKLTATSGSGDEQILFGPGKPFAILTYLTLTPKSRSVTRSTASVSVSSRATTTSSPSFVRICQSVWRKVRRARWGATSESNCCRAPPAVAAPFNCCWTVKSTISPCSNTAGS